MDGNNSTAPELLGFDWKIKTVLGSSSLATFQQPLVEVDFLLGAPGSTSNIQSSTVIDDIKIELNQAELKKLISVLEKAVNP